MIKVGDVLKSKCGESVIQIAFILENTSIGNVYCVAYPDLDNAIGWINQKEIEAYYDLPKEKWRPNIKDVYWYVDCDLEARQTTFVYGNHLDQKRLLVNNCFQTKAEAELARDKIREVLKGE